MLLYLYAECAQYVQYEYRNTLLHLHIYAKYAQYALLYIFSVLKGFFRYLLWLEDAVSADITPVQRDRRQAQRGIRGIMVFVQKPINLIRKNSQNSVSKWMVTQVPTTATGETVGRCPQGSDGMKDEARTSFCQIPRYLEYVKYAKLCTLCTICKLCKTYQSVTY